MIKYIYEICKQHNCSIVLNTGPDGVMSVTVFGKSHDFLFLIIRADWEEETIKECIEDVVGRVCE